MKATTTVNGQTVVHKDSEGVATCSAPDVCLTPPGVPKPYSNTARSRDLARGTKTVTVDNNPIAVKGSCFAISTDDEPGSIGGILSATNKGEAVFSCYAMNVIAEGKNVARRNDSMTMNGKKAANTVTVAEKQPNQKKPCDAVYPTDPVQRRIVGVIYAEAGGKSQDEADAMASAIYNRVGHASFPTDIHGVLDQTYTTHTGKKPNLVPHTIHQINALGGENGKPSDKYQAFDSGKITDAGGDCEAIKKAIAAVAKVSARVPEDYKAYIFWGSAKDVLNPQDGKIIGDSIFGATKPFRYPLPKK